MAFLKIHYVPSGLSYEDEMNRDRIFLGAGGNSIRQKLLQEKILDLQECIDICSTNEKTTSQLINIPKYPTQWKTSAQEGQRLTEAGADRGKQRYDEDQYLPFKYC